MGAGVTEQRIELACGLSLAVQVRTHAAARHAPLVLHLHGGAFQPVGCDCGQTVAALLAEAGAVVVSADYPAGPAHPFPVGIEAAFAVLERLYKDRARWSGRHASLFVAGEEAGGNLAAAVAMMARDRRSPPLTGQILLSPMLDAGLATCSMRTANAGPVGCKWADGWHDYLGTPEKAAHPYATPGAASRLAGLAPALILTAEDDPMRDESLRYAARLAESDVMVRSCSLDAPTGWPDALGQAALGGQAWCATLRAAFADFFTTATETARSGRQAFSRRRS